MTRHGALVALAFATLVVVRLPSLAQPAGGDQGLYAYVGQRILEGELPYRDAWDQKPPAVHLAYATMLVAWPDLRVVAAADLLLAVITALALLGVGSAFTTGHDEGFGRPRGRWSAAGIAAALIFLALSNPAFTRLGGVRVRAQCEVFIAALVAVALFCGWRAVRDTYRASIGWAVAGGAAVGLAATFKYNAAVYGVPLLAMIWLGEARERRGAASLAAIAGAAIPPVLMLLVFAAGGALDDLYQATIAYNVFYSGETYTGAWHFLGYLVTFPVRHSWLDSLWWMGGLGCLTLLATAMREPRHLVIPVWVAVACLSIAINGSRGLPQYFLQAQPALALAAGVALAFAWQRLSVVPRLVLVALVATGVWRVTTIPKAIDYTMHDVRYLTGQITREAHLARFGERASGDKYSALAIDELAGYLRANSTMRDRVLVFGFSSAALVEARRASATRFHWSRPVIVGFNEGRPGYGAAGMLAELERSAPSLVVLQRHDWDPDGPDSWTFFMNEPRLAGWLRDHYEPATELGNFVIWKRRA